jgi:hypothetical protein
LSYILLAEEYNVSREYTYSWNISGYDDVVYTYKWNIFELQNVVYTYKWNIYESINAIYTYSWNIYGYISRSFKYKWNIATSISIGVGKIKYHFNAKAIKNRFYRTFRDK